MISNARSNHVSNKASFHTSINRWGDAPDRYEPGICDSDNNSENDYSGSESSESDSEDDEPVFPVWIPEPAIEPICAPIIASVKPTASVKPIASVKPTAPKTRKYTARVPSSACAGQIIMYIMTHKPAEQPRIMNAIKVNPVKGLKSSDRMFTFGSILSKEELIMLMLGSYNPMIVGAFTHENLNEVLPAKRRTAP